MRASDTTTLLAQVPVFETLGPGRPRRVSPRSPCRGASRPVRSSSARATRATPATSSAHGHARAIREHADGRVDRARALRSRRHLRRAGDVRRRAALGDRRDARRRRGDRDPRRRTCAACCASTPTSPSSSSSRSAAGCARPTSASRASPSRRCRAASPASSGQLVVAGAAPRAPASRDVLVTITQADIAQLAGSCARVGQPLPGRARARGSRHAGPRAPHRPRPAPALQRYVY